MHFLHKKKGKEEKKKTLPQTEPQNLPVPPCRPPPRPSLSPPAPLRSSSSAPFWALHQSLGGGSVPGAGVRLRWLCPLEAPLTTCLPHPPILALAWLVSTGIRPGEVRVFGGAEARTG